MKRPFSVYYSVALEGRYICKADSYAEAVQRFNSLRSAGDKLLADSAKFVDYVEITSVGDDMADGVEERWIEGKKNGNQDGGNQGNH